MSELPEDELLTIKNQAHLYGKKEYLDNQYLLPPQDEYAYDQALNDFEAGAEFGHQLAMKRVHGLVEALKQIIDVTGTSTLQNKTAREALAKFKGEVE